MIREELSPLDALPTIVPEAEGRQAVLPSTPGLPIPTIESRGAWIVTLAVLATLFALQMAAAFVIPIVVAVLLAYALDPVVSFLQRIRVPRWLGAALVMSALLAAGVFGIYALRGQAQAIIDQVPAVVKKVSRAVDVFDSGPGLGLDNVRRAADALQRATDQATGNASGGGSTVVVVQQPGFRMKDLFLSGGRSALALFGQMLMMFLLAYFILLAGDKFKRKFVKVAGRTLSEKKITVQMFDQINLSIRRFMTMLLFSNVVLGILTWAAFRLVGLDNALTWGVVAGVLHIVPYFGPVVVMLATGIAALMQFGSIGMAVLVGGLSVVIAALIGLVLTTMLTGRIAKMNTVAVFIGLLLFGWIWGAWGVLLSVPIVVIIKVVSDHIEGLKPFAEFLGD